MAINWIIVTNSFYIFIAVISLRIYIQIWFMPCNEFQFKSIFICDLMKYIDILLVKSRFIHFCLYRSLLAFFFIAIQNYIISTL